MIELVICKSNNMGRSVEDYWASLLTGGKFGWNKVNA
jgi:hypothetical protein